MKDKRFHDRVTVRADINIQEGDLSAFREIEDIGLGGICINTPTPNKVGNKIEVMILHPNGKDEILIRGEVVWNADAPVSKMGVRFVDIDPKTQKSLQEVIDFMAQ